MEFKGEDFVKKVQIKQEKENLKQRLQDLEHQDKSLNQENIPNLKIDLNESVSNQPKQELGDILLSQNHQNSDKKKYVILGLVLVILFLITIIVIRLINNSDKQNNEMMIPSKASVVEETSNDDIEEQYQKIINEKIKKLKQEKSVQRNKDIPIAKTPSSNVQQKDITQTDEPQEIDETQFTAIKEEAIKEPVTSPKKIESSVTKKEKSRPNSSKKVGGWPIKKQTLREPEEVDFQKVPQQNKSVRPQSTASTVKPKPSKKGFFVQLGAFKTQPSADYLVMIQKAGYTYILHQENIKGTVYTKLLVGPYTSRQLAQKALPSMKSSLGVTNLFIKKL